MNWNRAATCAAPAPGVAEAMVQGLHANDGLRSTLAESAGPADEQIPLRTISEIRALAAKLFHHPWPDRVIFTPGATFALNQAVHSISDGGMVLTTPLEHNSLLRPLHQAGLRGVQVQYAEVTDQGFVDLGDVEQRIQLGGVDWLAVSLASNVFGTLQPLSALCAMARAHGVKVILDLSQGGGQVDVDLTELQPAYAVVPGHKGLHGPRGVGLLFAHGSENPSALVSGGTGSYGEHLEMPLEWPGCLEAGTMNLPGIHGLGAALHWRLQNPAPIDAQRRLLADLESWLAQRSDVRLLPSIGTPWPQRLPILCFEPLAAPADVVAALLDQMGLQVRAGNMCAALAGPALHAKSPVIRLSPPEDADAAEYEVAKQLLDQALALQL